jgi:hypothetical protein
MQEIIPDRWRSKVRKYVYKRMWSMGFIENGVGSWEEDGRTLMFDIMFDNEPQFFAGTPWRSFIRRYGEDENWSRALHRKQMRRISFVRRNSRVPRKVRKLIGVGFLTGIQIWDFVISLFTSRTLVGSDII